MHFYTSVLARGNSIMVCGYLNGKRYREKIKYRPYHFIPTKKETKYKTIHGQPVEKLNFDNIYEAKDFYNRYKEVENFDIYGLNQYSYTYIYDTFGDILYDTTKIKTCILDIEVSTNGGYPDMETASNEVTAITMMYDDITFVLGYKDFETNDDSVKYVKCEHEHDLLQKFLKIWTSDIFRPDVVTGWNVELFDIPYMVTRISRILGESEAKQLSPWGYLYDKKIQWNGQDRIAYIPLGINTLDYMVLYKKFISPVRPQESYRLDHIAHMELDEKKLDYSEYGSLNELYEQNHQKFIEYNIRDCTLIKKLDQKLKLLELVYTIAFSSGCNFDDALGTNRSWDTTIHNFLMDRNIVIPQGNRSLVNRHPVGAYVKDPIVGMHSSVVSFDLTSLYPHLIMQYNISPETFVQQLSKTLSIDQLLEDESESLDSIKEFLIEQNLSLAANGSVYSNKKQGFLPALMEHFFNVRKEYKNEMLKLKEQFEKTQDESLKNSIAKYDTLQHAFKIRLNSAYGALANKYFRWYDINYAESITMSGQLTIKWAEKKMNEFLNRKLKTKGKDYVIASDTDSLYVDMSLYSSDVEEIDKFCETEVQQMLDVCFADLKNKMNAREQKMFMKREGISSRGVFVAKKRYMLNVLDNEGIRYHEPNIKMMGIEAVRSSTPQVVKDAIKETVKIMLQGTEEEVQAYIADFRRDYHNMSFNDIAFPRGVNGLDKYSDRVTIYKKATPIHVRGALLYNKFLQDRNLQEAHEQIYNGSKVKFCYLEMPNPLHENVIAVPSLLPPEMDFINDYVDHDLQFSKSYLEPMKHILEAADWHPEKRNTLTGFFT
jgi:DNA polymerase elongation subunit (family B)